MADPAKFKSVSVSIESLAKKEGKKHGYKNGKA